MLYRGKAGPKKCYIFYTTVHRNICQPPFLTKAQMLPEKPHHAQSSLFSTQAIDDDCNQTGQMTAVLDWPQVRPECGPSAEGQAWGLRTQPPDLCPFGGEAGVKLDACSSGQSGVAHMQDSRPPLGLPCPFPSCCSSATTALPQGLCTAVLSAWNRILSDHLKTFDLPPDFSSGFTSSERPTCSQSMKYAPLSTPMSPIPA